MIRRVHIRVSGTDTEMYLFPEQAVPEEVTTCSTLQLPEVVGRSYRTYKDLVSVWNDDEQIPGLIDVVEFEDNLKTLVVPLKESEEIPEKLEEVSDTTSNSTFEMIPSQEKERKQAEPVLPKEEGENPQESKTQTGLNKTKEKVKILGSRHKLGKFEVEHVAQTICAAVNVNHTFTIEKNDFSDRILPDDIIIRKISSTQYNIDGGLPQPIYCGKKGISIHKKYLPGAGLPYQISSNEIREIKVFRPQRSRLK
jgi:hypothetical protein